MQTKLVWQPGVAWALGGPQLRQTPYLARHIRATPNHLTKATVPLLPGPKDRLSPVRDRPSTRTKNTETNALRPRHTLNLKSQPLAHSTALLETTRPPRWTSQTACEFDTTRPAREGGGKKAQSWELSAPSSSPQAGTTKQPHPSPRYWGVPKLTCRPVSQPHRQPGGCRHHDPRRHLPVLPARLVRVYLRCAALPTSGSFPPKQRPAAQSPGSPSSMDEPSPWVPGAASFPRT